MSVTFGHIVQVFKLRIGATIALSALVGVAVTPGPVPSVWQTLVLGLTVLAASASAGAFNQFVERDLDARMARTRARPFVTGELRPGAIWHWVIWLLLFAAVGAAVFAINAVSGVFIFLGAIFYGVVYTVWLKRRTWLNIVVGGLSGSFALLAGAAVVNPELAPTPIILAVVLFLWTPPHFWSLATALHKDYAEAGVPMLPVVVGDAKASRVILAHTVSLVLLSLVPVAFGLGWIYLAGAGLGGAYFVYRSIQLVRAPGPAAAMRNFLASLLQLGLLYLGAIADVMVSGNAAGVIG